MAGPVVGIIANPVSARDIRRVVAHAGSLQVTDRANIVLRLLAGLAAAGISQVVMMPENAGIRTHLARAMKRAANTGEARFPGACLPRHAGHRTGARQCAAARLMRGLDVKAIIVLGGDGTHRVVVPECGKVPIAGVSTGTNNAFPETREPTVTGLAVGLAVTGAVPAATAFVANKRLEVAINGRREIALVDVAVVDERYRRRAGALEDRDVPRAVRHLRRARRRSACRPSPDFWSRSSRSSAGPPASIFARPAERAVRA